MKFGFGIKTVIVLSMGFRLDLNEMLVLLFFIGHILQCITVLTGLTLISLKSGR